MDDLQPERSEPCPCHVCGTLRTILTANTEATHDARVPTPLLLTFAQTGDLLGVSEGTVRGLVAEGELRSVYVKTYSRRRIPRVEIDDYVGRLLTGQLRAWVEARRDLDQWGLRYMGDRRTYVDKNGRRLERTVAWHLGDKSATLCGATAVGRWEIQTSPMWITRLCRECEATRDRIRLEKLERRHRPPVVPKDIRPMLTVVQHPDGSESVRRAGWHLGDGTVTLCGQRREHWRLPDRKPRARPCGVCQRTAGLDERG